MWTFIVYLNKSFLEAIQNNDRHKPLLFFAMKFVSEWTGSDQNLPINIH